MSHPNWLPIEGSNYDVSDLGQVRNRKTGNVLKTSNLVGGYQQVTICGERKVSHRVHRLVATAFIPNPFNHPVVNHKDFNTRNNCVANLEWTDHRGNFLFSLVRGRIKTQRGENHWSSKVSSKERDKIQKMYGRGLKQTELASLFGITQGQVSRIIRGITTNRKNKYAHLYV